jgi:imidazole glycerol phosphate synthase glutamine amidotransferase subunit
VTTDIVHIVRTGAANLASVCAALERAGVQPVVTDDPATIESSPRVILPGVGAFGPAMRHLRQRGIDRAVRRRIESDQPVLAVCLGLQLLLESSEEAPGVDGMAIARGAARRYPDDRGLRVPQIGWNRVTPRDGFTAAVEGWAYFANSYRLIEPPPGWTIATADYAGEFVAAMQKSPRVVACQFHPELSGAWGASLVANWLGVAGVRA